jgi:hypothetical protein
VNVVKFDVEGGGELVLCGATSILARPQALIIFELNQDASQRLGVSAKEAWKLLRQAGYSSPTLWESTDRIELKARVPQTSENVAASYWVHE